MPPDARKGFAFPLRSVLFCEGSALDMGGRSLRRAMAFSPESDRLSAHQAAKPPAAKRAPRRLLALSSILTIIAYPVFLLV